MRKTTYEEFYKSVEYLDVAEYENTFGVEANHDGVKGVFCYLGCGLHIDVMPHGYGLILDRTYHESDQLHELEKLLYDFCDEEGYLDEVEPAKVEDDIKAIINYDAYPSEGYKYQVEITINNEVVDYVSVMDDSQPTVDRVLNEFIENRQIDINIDDYINWDALARDYDLKSGDLSPAQLGTLEGLFETFINQNR